MKCTFCDVHKYGFFGNASLPDLEYQIRYIIEHEDVRFTNRFNVHYARMGEPTWNPAVLDLLSLDWTTWLKSVVFTLSPSIP